MWPIVENYQGCWLWAGEINRNGYGTFRKWVNGRRKRIMAHRWIYEQMVGPIPSGAVLDHRCSVRRCCNPMHLEAVSVAVNTHRGRAPLFKKAYLYARDRGLV